MAREVIDFVSPEVEAKFYDRNGLSSHVGKLRRKSHGISRWMVFAVFIGVVVALALVRLVIH